jgi:protein-ribulosamine 3-kinase
MWDAIEAAISEASGEAFRVESAAALAGGCINDAHCLSDGRRRFFAKSNKADGLAMFSAESEGLNEIRRSNTVRVPAPLCHGSSKGLSWLVLEFIEMGNPGATTHSDLGEQLALMHSHSAATFGWTRDNTIGTTPQVNTPTSNWVTFLRERRIGYQLALAHARGAPPELQDRGQRLLLELPKFFSNYQPEPSLLHGDLWGGNWNCDTQASPVLFDPAIYYGDREADLAMTELFGGFDERFYQSYRNAWTLDPGYSTRKVLYNLYHILNHYNLFGGSYARQAMGMVDTLISEI